MSATPRVNAGACAGQVPMLTSPQASRLVVVSEECIGTPAVAFQPRTLRRVVKQSRWGFNRSAARTHRKPSHNLDEENFTRASGGPQGQAKKERKMSYVMVIDQDKRPLDPVHPGRARKPLSKVRLPCIAAIRLC